MEYGEGFYRKSWLERRIALGGFYFRDLLRAGWLPLLVAVWWAWYLASPLLARRKGRKRSAATGDDKTIRHWALLVALLVLTSALISVQSITHTMADMRYLVMALPFVLFMSAVCADWAWQKSKPAGAVLLALLIATNFAAGPFLVKDIHKLWACPSERFTLPALLREIHQPYPSAIADAVAYLRANAAQDDTVFVNRWPDSAVLLYYLSDQLIFCCGLKHDAKLPREKLRALKAPLYAGDTIPEWLVDFRGLPETPPGYRRVYTGEAFAYPTHRPEWEYRCFRPPAGRGGVKIYRRL